jgi:crossover junction endodeoxyribonuclease RuvC
MTLRAIGIDPGTHHTGFGVIETRGPALAMIECGVISAEKDDPLEKRLATMHAGLRDVIARTSPAHAAVEGVFFSKNVKSAIALGHARGVALLAVAEAKLELFEYAPAEVKRAVVGNGRAEKEQVAHMVRLLLNHREAAARLDVTDALAVAICHAHTSSLRMRIAK